MIDPCLEGKVVLVTGANHGIGAATAVAFAGQGSKVFVHYYRVPTDYADDELARALEAGVGSDVLYRARQQSSAEEVIAEIASRGGIAGAREADLGEAGQIPQLFAACEDTLGPVDVLVNNHTHCVLETFDPALVSDEGAGVAMVSAQEIDAHFTINARAYALLMAEYVQRYLVRGASWGRIINISTDASHAHVANVSYSASKHAIESYTRSAAAELGKYGITVNVVAPGPIQTGYIPPDLEAELAETTPLGRVGRPEDLADAVVLLASEQARWVTGQLLYVGGGFRMAQ